jgi:TPR repeat protein
MRRPDLALLWYETAGARGDLKSQVNAGIIHRTGPRGVERNPEAAAEWFRMAAEQGSSTAQYSLGLLLENRTAPAKSNVEAYAWFRVAMAQGNSRARARVSSLENRLSPEDLVVAQAMSEEFWETFAAPFRADD